MVGDVFPFIRLCNKSLPLSVAIVVQDYEGMYAVRGFIHPFPLLDCNSIFMKMLHSATTLPLASITMEWRRWSQPFYGGLNVATKLHKI